MTTHPVILLRIDREAGKHTRHPRHLHPALDLKYIQAGLAPLLGAPPPLLDGWLAPFDSEAFAARAIALRPRYAIVRAVTWCLEESVHVAARLKAAGIVTIAVGQQVQHVMASPHPGWNEAFDLAVPGEPEEAVPALLRRLLAGEPLDTLYQESLNAMAANKLVLVQSPDELAVPQFSAEEMQHHAFPFPIGSQPLSRWGYVLTSWGCPRPCRHCTLIVRKSAGQILRERSVSRVVDEVLALRDQGAEAIAFEDDSLPVNRPRFLSLMNELVRRDLALPWMANARPDELDEERVAAASAAGALLFKVGVDSGAPRLIERLGKARDGDAWVEATERGFELLNRHRIGSVALFMVGMPGETRTEAEASIRLAHRLRPDYLQVQVYRPYPDVPLWHDLPESARLQGAEYHYLTPASNCSRIPVDEIGRLQRRFYRGFYLHPGYVGRHLARHWRHYLSGHALSGMKPLRFLLASS